MSHILDRPVWSALTTQHAALAEGGARARRYDPTIVPFAATRDDSDASLAALKALAAPGEEMVLAQAGNIVLPSGMAVLGAADAVQMVLERPPPPRDDSHIMHLSDADAAEMLALATLTEPGPFTLRAQALGAFFGVKEDGRLVAMAGERLKQDGFCEISGVCTHPDARGRGLARRLSVFMTHRLIDRGETPYLHAYATNRAAIRLYESIGFTLRSLISVMAVRRKETAGTR